MTQAYRILLGQPDGKGPLGGPRRRCKNIIKIYLQDVGLGSMEWIDLARDTDRYRAVINLGFNVVRGFS